jgi:hypothetical protein
MRLFTCPCCERLTEPRTSPLTEAEGMRAYAMMLHRGWTAQRLLDERREDLDGISPDLTAFIRRMADAEAVLLVHGTVRGVERTTS